MLKDLATAYDIYMELIGNLQEGTKVQRDWHLLNHIGFLGFFRALFLLFFLCLFIIFLNSFSFSSTMISLRSWCVTSKRSTISSSPGKRSVKSCPGNRTLNRFRWYTRTSPWRASLGTGKWQFSDCWRCREVAISGGSIALTCLSWGRCIIEILPVTSCYGNLTRVMLVLV